MNKDIEYTIESISEEGVYYLLPGWTNGPEMWVTKSCLPKRVLFKTGRGAKASLTALLKVMPEYKTDRFCLAAFDFSKNELTKIEALRGGAL